MQTSTNWSIPRPNLPIEGASDSPVDLPQLFHDRDAVIDLFAQAVTGPLSSRPTSTSGTPGKQNRFFVVTDQANSPRIDWDYGTGWVTIATAVSIPFPAASVMLRPASFGINTARSINSSGNNRAALLTSISDADNQLIATAWLQFKVKVTGWYQVDYSASIQIGNGTGPMSATLFQNGAQCAAGQSLPSPGNMTFPLVKLNGTFFFNQNDIVEPGIQINTVSGTFWNPDQRFTYFTMRQVSNP